MARRAGGRGWWPLRKLAPGVVSLALAAGCGSHLTEEELAAAQGALTNPTSVAVPNEVPTSLAGVDTVGTGPARPGPALNPVGAPPDGRPAGPRATPDRNGAGRPVAPGAGTAIVDRTSVGPRDEIVMCSFGNSTGVLGAVSGPAPAANAAWASYTNARGGLAGHRVRMIIADTGGAAANAQAIAQRCVEQERAVAIFNEYTFGEIDGALPYLKAKKVPVIGSIGAALASDHNIMVFNPLNGADVGNAWGFLNTIIAQTDKRKLAVLYCQEAATCAQQVVSFGKLLPYKGLEIVYKAQVSLVQPDYTAQLLQARNAGAEIMVLLLDSASVGRVARNAAQQNYAPVLAGSYNLGIQATLDQGPVLNGLILASRTPAYSTSPLLRDYRDAMARYQPGKPLGDVGAGAFVSGALLERYASAFLAKTSVTSQDLLDLLYSLKNEKLGGLLPGITFAPSDDRTQTNRCIAPVRLDNGAFVQRGGFVCAPDWRPGT
ncbi:ABC transporter substrate-binding protein [Sporichthya polymorpha]|uniref:ABC transporter substrate-binding protein n=1 Tax=Sporichthya polymorpha TaxID=35751 RepID=UPI0003A3CF0A|nr:ABC transporter substrate-binding protein [Sporichthya polymorpha]